MGFIRRENTFASFFILSILSASLQLGATRPLGCQWIKQEGLLLHSLPKGTVTPSSPNPCTYIPVGSPGSCKLSGMNIAGNVARSPPAFSKHGAVAFSISKNTPEQDQIA
ncbi:TRANSMEMBRANE PROTEIN [Salix koriyanagi]|uniref:TRANSMEMBRANE PROTEIN n=1 Tax=Salix koriyanagi TaxID=2511006 RepID=A0A9Q0P403_9ROSI|nr:TRANSMEMBRANE PROTEIN [Salix koriyanagi]